MHLYGGEKTGMLKILLIFFTASAAFGVKCLFIHYWREINILPSISSLTDRVFSIFRQKKVRSDPSEMDIKVVIPAPTS